MLPIVIIGTGHAGITLAREIRRIDQDIEVVLITQDDGANYYKPNLSKAYAAGKTAEGLIMADAAKQADTLAVSIKAASTVTAMDSEKQQLSLDNGETLNYGQLVLALGAEQRKIPVAGNAQAAIISVNNRLDFANFRRLAEHAKHITIMGGGLIGCEFANDLLTAGYKVSVVDPLAWPLGRLLPEQAGRALQTALADLGLDWHLNQTVSSLHTTGDAYTVTLSNGETFSTHLLLSAVGLQPNLGLAKAAELDCHIGIVVDEFLASSQPNIYALGDCAELAGQVLPYIAPINHAAKALAATLTGTATSVSMPAMPVVVKTPACPAVISTAPQGSDGSWKISGVAPDLECRYEDKAGQLLGCALLGEATKKRMAYQQELPPVFPR